MAQTWSVEKRIILRLHQPFARQTNRKLQLDGTRDVIPTNVDGLQVVIGLGIIKARVVHLICQRTQLTVRNAAFEMLKEFFAEWPAYSKLTAPTPYYCDTWPWPMHLVNRHDER